MIWMVFTELLPSLTGLRTASEVPLTSLNMPTVLFSCPTAGRQRLIEGDIPRHSALFHCWIDTGYVTVRDTIAGVDNRFLTNLNVLRLSLSDFDLGFELCRVGHAGEIIANLKSLANLHGQLL